MALDIIMPIFVELIKEPINKYFVAPIKRHVSYAFKCGSKVQGLQEQVERLKNKKHILQLSVDDSSISGAEIFPNVTKWLTTAKTDIGEADKIIQGKEEVKSKCFFGFCPDLKTRYQLGKISEKKALAIDKLCNEQGLKQVSFQPPLQQIVEPSLYSREALPSRVLMLNQVMDALKDPNLHAIGVCGMGGVGKTTLAKEVQAKALQEKLFETVIMVPVSQTPELRRIQGEIADFLGMKFLAEEIPGRASQLYKRLEKSKVLIILDDLWQKLDLKAVGIPSQAASENFKIMLTSRSRDLLSSEMRVQKLFSLEALEEEETLRLFQMSVAEASDPKFHHIATQIAKRCAGLPLLIQIVSTELTNKESYEWNNMLNQLSALGDGEIYQKVHRVLESSYENLPGEEIKQFFLLCALFGQSNIQIKYLLTHSMGLGLFKNIFTVEEARDRIFTFINKLKAKSLLLDGDLAGNVEMHDVVRDTAVSIASRVQHAFIGARKIRFRDWPDKDCTRMSLPYCNVSELPVHLDCPEAEVFSLFTEDLSLEIPDTFFDGKKKLKVVDLRGMRLVSFPSSFASLANLQTLCLHKCKLENMAVLGELRQMEFLSFANSNVVELPREIEALTRLKLLDLQGCSDLRVIHVNIFSRLCSLEELYMLNSFERWNSEGNVSLMELEDLACLSTLEIQIPDPKMIPTGFKCFSQLRRYKISIGRLWEWKGEPEGSRMLKLKVEAGVHLEDHTELLLRETAELFLEGVRGIDIIFYERFPKLKHMNVKKDSDIQHLIQSSMPYSAFPVLESLYLNNLHMLEIICSGQLRMGSFSELQILSISACSKLSSLFSLSSLKFLQKLRELEVILCDSLVAVVGEGSEDEHHNYEVMELSQLSSLKLLYLPHLTGFCKMKEGTEQMGMLFNTKVSFPNLTSLEVVGCNSLNYIFTASMVKHLMLLKTFTLADCELVEEIIQSKKMEEIEEDSSKAIVFPKLDLLVLVNLENLKRFSSSVAIEFPSLSLLRISNCTSMGNFVVRDSNCESTEEYLFNEMVTFSNLDGMRINDMNSIKYLWDEQFIAHDSFFKLSYISIENCSKLSVVFPSKICTRFRRVKMLRLVGCGEMEEIYQRINLEEVNNPFSLRDLEIYDLQSLKQIWNKESDWNVRSFSTFQNLQSVVVQGCEDLKFVFPESVGCGLPQLQQIRLKDCNQLEVMIAKAKDGQGGINACFQFPELKKLEFEDLMEMRSFYEGESHTCNFPDLKSLEVLQCSNISLEKLIPNVEELIMGGQDFHAIHGYVSARFCSKLKKVTLCKLYEESSIAVVFSFLGELKFLEMLVLEYCFLRDIFRMHDPLDRRRIGDEQHHYLRVKNLQLRHIRGLNYITNEDSQVNLILQHLQTLHLKHCDDLEGIAQSSTCFLNLTTLHVYKCHEMKDLVTASTAKTMVHLMEMKVADCKMIEEIIAKDGNSEEHGTVLILNKLQNLELKDLPNFNCFCSNKYTFSFLLLEQVCISGCPRMKIFCSGVVRAPKLRGILFEDERQWEGNLNATISSQIRIWVGEHLEDGIRFQNLESVEVVNSTISLKAVLFANQMQFLNKLREITVRDCDLVQVVFDLEGPSAEEGYIGLLPKLEELKLINLPELTQLCNKTPKGSLDFNKLQVLEINGCSRLEYALTWSMASCLSQLKGLTLENCEMMETFILDEEEGEAKVTFDKLECIVLENMPKFSSIYLGSGDLECPSLTAVKIRDCPSIKALLLSTQVRSINQVFHKLEELWLSIDMSSVRGMIEFKAPTDLFSNIKTAELRNFSATAISHVLLVRFLSRLLNLDRLVLSDSSFQELLSSRAHRLLISISELLLFAVIISASPLYFSLEGYMFPLVFPSDVDTFEKSILWLQLCSNLVHQQLFCSK